jgi:hypothetical protein
MDATGRASASGSIINGKCLTWDDSSAAIVGPDILCPECVGNPLCRGWPTLAGNHPVFATRGIGLTSPSLDG